MKRTQREIEVWGTVLFLDVISSVDISTALAEVENYVHHVDEIFSTYKSGSKVSQLRRGEIAIEQCPPEVIEVWNLSLELKELTQGAFDPWTVAGGFDPSGLVKGWAADNSAEILKAAGAEHVQVNAAGDLALRGGFTDQLPWSIGVVNPDNRLEILQTFEIQDGAIATSGTYERGAHIYDPHTGLIAIGAKSATVIGPNGAIADALATALMVSGRDGAIWFTAPELAEYSAWVIERHQEIAWSIGPATA
jgi:thiamine biosynthesis lipoprotein